MTEFAWKRWPERRQCWQCKREPLKLDEVGEYRRIFPGGQYQLRCTNCQRQNVEKSMRETRERMGMK